MKLISSEKLTKEEKQKYIDWVKSKAKGEEIKDITLAFDDDYVNVHWTTETKRPFERIRRITGYLVGDMNKWNNAKTAEEKARTKHM
ncbi:anaerobic ribonucleoside-triphosphate reductase [Eubacteriales bacterium KG125]